MFMRVEDSESGCGIAQPSPNIGVARRWTHRTEERSSCPLLSVAVGMITLIVSAITHKWMILLTDSKTPPPVQASFSTMW
jgi:hypothetical protein